MRLPIARLNFVASTGAPSSSLDSVVSGTIRFQTELLYVILNRANISQAYHL